MQFNQCNLKTRNLSRRTVKWTYCGCFVKTLLDTVCNSIWSKPLWQRQSRRRWACVIHRVVDSWLGMLPPVEAKYTQQAVRGPVGDVRVHATSAHAAGPRFWRENQQRSCATELGAAYPWTGRTGSLLYIVPSLHCLPVSSGSARRSTIAAAPILYAWDPQAVVAVHGTSGKNPEHWNVLGATKGCGFMLVLGTPEDFDLCLLLQNWPLALHFYFWVRAQRKRPKNAICQVWAFTHPKVVNA